MEHLVGFAVAMVLALLQIEDHALVFLGIWLVNFVTAWLLYKAAFAQGRRRAVWHGVFSALAPVFALITFMRLYLHDRLTLLEGIQKSRDES